MLFAGHEMEWLTLGESRLGLMSEFVPDHQLLYQELTQAVAWEQPTVRVYGKSHLTPRLVAFYGDEGVEYRYSGITHHATGWPTSLQLLRDRLDSIAGTRFNTVLLNWYRDGSDAMGYHADDEASLGRAPTIASVSLGAERRFLIKPRYGKAQGRREIQLPGGSLLIMAERFQAEWVHAIPVERRVREGRINLTFRRVSNKKGTVVGSGFHGRKPP